MEHTDAQGRDLLMVYMSLVKPCKEAAAEHMIFKPTFEAHRTDKMGNSHLMYAAINRAPLKVFEMLVACKVDVNKVNDEKQNVMGQYLHENTSIDRAVVKCLLKAGFEVSLLAEEVRALIAEDI